MTENANTASSTPDLTPPKDPLDAPENRKTRARTVVLISTLVPVTMVILPKSLFPLFRDPLLLLWVVFGIMYYFQPQLTRATRKVPGPIWLKFILFSVPAGWIGELCAWTGNFLDKNPEPPLLHPQLIPDLILAIGYYGGWACGWAIAFSLVRWSIPLVILTVGTFGWVVEQKAALLISFFQNIATQPLGGAYWLLYIMMVYGCILCLGYIPVQIDFRPRFPKVPPWVHFLKIPVTWGLTWVGIMIILRALMFLTGLLHIIPEKRNIVEYPFF
jgi:hypothetical protein